MWRKEKERLIDVGLIKRIWVDCEEYIWNYNYHVYQDMFSSKGKKHTDRFVQSFDRLDGKNKELFFVLFHAFQPAGLEFKGREKIPPYEDKKDEKGMQRVEQKALPSALPFTPFLPPLGRPFFLPSALPLCRNLDGKGGEKSRPCTLPFAIPCEGKKDEKGMQRVEQKALPLDGLIINKEKGIINKEKGSNSDVKKFIDWWFEKFQKTFGEKYQVVGGKDGNIAKDLLHEYKFEKLASLGEAFFKSDDPFIINSSYSLGVFKSQINKLLTLKGKKKQGKNERPDYYRAGQEE